MTLWDRLRRRGDHGEHAAADWVAAGSPLPDAGRRVEGLAFEVGQTLWIQNHRAPKPWPERRALVERVMTGPRWSEVGYRCSAAGEECAITDADGRILVRLLHDPDTGGHIVERYRDDGRVAARARYDDHGRAAN